jgi:tRNA pseudouridine55 synthase
MPSGILLLDKPHGLSSNAALQRVRALFAGEKAGHVGTLDPLATGMLPLCLGEATKIAGDLLAGRKCYRFSIGLGSATTTGDSEGEVTERAPVPPLAASLVESALARFRGPQRQLPPMYSAIKQEGQPLYRLARRGVSVPRAARAIEIFELVLRDWESGALELETLCSKGTYVRVLAVDIAAALGTCGHVTALRRLYVEPFASQPMHTLESLAAARQAEARQAEEWPQLLPIDWPLQHLPVLRLQPGEAERFAHGQRIATDGVQATPRARVYDARGRFRGIGATDAAGWLQPRRLIRPVP